MCNRDNARDVSFFQMNKAPREVNQEIKHKSRQNRDSS